MTNLSNRSDPLFRSATDVSDHVLEETRQAFLQRDFERLSNRMALPQIVGTFEGDRQVCSIEETRALFSDMLNFFENHNVIDMWRLTISARFVANDEVQSTTVTQFLFQGYVLSDEVVAHGKLRRFNGIWQIAEARYATGLGDINRILSGNTRRQKKLSDSYHMRS